MDVELRLQNEQRYFKDQAIRHGLEMRALLKHRDILEQLPEPRWLSVYRDGITISYSGADLEEDKPTAEELGSMIVNILGPNCRTTRQWNDSSINGLSYRIVDGEITVTIDHGNPPTGCEIVPYDEVAVVTKYRVECPKFDDPVEF